MAVGKTIKSEVCVIGGGPAGSTIARRLALLGHSVCLVEAAVFPRRHIGESLPAGIIPLLDFLGVRNEVEQAGFLRPGGAIVSWSDGPQQAESMGEPGFHVDRGRFDQLLLNSAAYVGVRVLQPALAGVPHRDRELWKIPIQMADDSITLSSRFLVDATGRRSLLPGKLQRDDVPTIALYAYWTNDGNADPAARVEAGHDEWFWGAPLPDDTFSAAVFLDPDRCKAGLAGLTSLYESLLQNSTLLAPCVSGRRVTDVMACDASRRYSTSPVGKDFIKVGEAAFTIDPLSSQGVQAAITSAIQGSIVVNTILKQPASTELAQTFYRDRQHETVVRDRVTSSGFYREKASNSPAAFWQKRGATQGDGFDKPRRQNGHASPTTRVQLASEVKLMTVPVARNDMVASADGLQHPALDRPVAYVENCSIGALLPPLATEIDAGMLVDLWSTQMPRNRACKAFSWLWSYGVIVPATVGSSVGEVR